MPRPRARMGKIRATLPVAAAVALMLATTACAPSPAPPNAANAPRQSPRDAATRLDVSTLDLRDDADRLIEALARLGDRSAHADPSADAAWRRTGLRAVAVPLDQLASVLGPLASPGDDAEGTPLTAVASAAQKRVALDGRWAELVREPGPPASRTLLLADRRLRLDPGSARLLTRGWIEPVPGPDGTPAPLLRVEIVPQWIDAQRPGSDEPVDRSLVAGKLPDAAERGQIFPRLRAAFALDGSSAVVIVHEAPAADWNALAGPRAVEADVGAPPGDSPRAPRGLPRGQVRRTDSPRGEFDDPPLGPERAPAGPDAGSFRARTLGELLLAAPALDDPGPRWRRVLVLIPRAGARFELLESDAGR